MNMRSLAAKVFLIFLLAAGTAFSQDFHLYGFSLYDLEFLGSGARARSMGGAFVGVADDASALTWNPAGLIQVSRTQASVSGAVVRLKLENDVQYAQNPGRSFLSKYTKDLLNLEAGSFVAPVRIKGHPFVAAVNYQRAQDDNDEIHATSGVPYLFTTSSGTASGTDDFTSQTSTIRNVQEFSLGFGTDIYEKLSFGGSVNIYFGGGTSEFRSAFADTTPLIFGDQAVDTVEARYASSVRDQQSNGGINLTGSLMYRTEKVRVGVTVRTPCELVTDHGIKRADTLYIKSVRIPGPGNPTGGRPTLYLGKTKIEVPLTVGLGAAVQVTPAFLVSGDVEIRSTGSNKYFVRTEEAPATSADSINLFTLPGSIYYNDTTETSYYDASGDLIEIFNEFDLGYESSMQIRLGAEYMLATSIGTIPLRGGLRFTQLPYTDVSGVERDVLQQVKSGFALGDKISQTCFSFGSGIHWNQVWLDFGVELKTVEQTESGKSTFDDFALYDYSNLRKKTSPSFTASFTGFF